MIARKLLHTSAMPYELATSLSIFIKMYSNEIGISRNSFQTVIVLYWSYLFVLDVLRMLNNFHIFEIYTVNSEIGLIVLNFYKFSVLLHHRLQREMSHMNLSGCSLNISFIFLVMS